MNTEKFANSKLYAFCEVLWHIVILNFLTVITSLGVITLIPSVTACLKSFKDYSLGESKNTFAVYFSNFKKLFLKSLGYSVLFIVLVLALGYSILLYYANLEDEMYHQFYTLGMYVTILFSIVVVIVYIQIPLINVYFNFSFGQCLKNSFFMGFRFIFVSLVGLIFIGASVVLAFIKPFLWAFIGLSLPIYMVFLVSKNKYMYLSQNIDDIHDEDKYELDFKEEDK